MPVTAETPAPYATSATILDLIERHRNRGLPSPVNGDVLVRSGVSNSLVSRTLQALYALDLIDDNGNPSAALEGIRLASESEYQQRLSEWLKSAYADVLTFVDPVADDETAIRDAFRNYNPAGQQPRMVTLFLNLLTAAGMLPEKEKSHPRPNQPTKNASKRQSAPKSKHRLFLSGRSTSPAIKNPSGLPAPIAGLLTSLPPEGTGWTQEKRDQFLITLGAVLDFCYPIGVVKPDKTESEAGEEEDG